MPVSVFTVNKELLVTSFILVLILYPLVNTRAAPVGVREGTAQMVTPHVFIVVAMDRNACTPCKASLSVRTLMLLINITSSVLQQSGASPRPFLVSVVHTMNTMAGAMQFSRR
jgi:hypothetical protein